MPATQTKPEKPAESRLRSEAGKISETDKALPAWLVANDARLFATDTSLEAAHSEFVTLHGFTSRDHFAGVAGAFCKFFAVELRQRRVAPADELTVEQWDALKGVAEQLLPWFRGLTLLQCLRLIRTRVSTNAQQLAWLPSRFHVWSDVGKPIAGSEQSDE